MVVVAWEDLAKEAAEIEEAPTLLPGASKTWEAAVAMAAAVATEVVATEEAATTKAGTATPAVATITLATWATVAPVPGAVKEALVDKEAGAVATKAVAPVLVAAREAAVVVVPHLGVVKTVWAVAKVVKVAGTPAAAPWAMVAATVAGVTTLAGATIATEEVAMAVAMTAAGLKEVATTVKVPPVVIKGAVLGQCEATALVVVLAAVAAAASVKLPIHDR